MPFSPPCPSPPSRIPILGIAVLTGTGVFLLHRYFAFQPFDPLVVSLVVGILLRAVFRHRFAARVRSFPAHLILISIGIVFYAGANLDFTIMGKISWPARILVLIVILVYFSVVFLVGRRLGQNRKITCLVAVGSAICGASAIALTAPAIEGEAEEVSTSLLAVTLAALLALFVVIPFFGALLRLPPETYALMSGSLLQFSGFVRESMNHLHYLPAGGGPEAANLAMAIKSTRYFALLAALPLLASLVQRKPAIPLSLWLFLLAGIGGTWVRLIFPEWFQGVLLPVVETAYLVLWSSAMAAVGLQADLHHLLSDQGYRAFVMAAIGFGAALSAFLVWWLVMTGGG